jgi:phenylalanyl-tRNA synthetase beta chain
LESAWFSPTRVRRTSKTLALRSESSHRFERGVDLQSVLAAGRRAVELIQETAGGVLDGEPLDVFPGEAGEKKVALRYARVGRLLGVEIPADRCDAILASLGLVKTAASDADQGIFIAPSWRSDLKREADLIEEVCRIHGVDKIPASTPRRVAGSPGKHDFDATFDAFSEIRTILNAAGLDEAQGQTLIHHTAAEAVLAAAPLIGGKPGPKGAPAPAPAIAPLDNPLSSDMDTLRPSLIPGLLSCLGANRAQREQDVRLFEIGRVFHRDNGRHREGWRLAIALTGARAPLFWSGPGRDEKIDAADLKGVLETLFERFGRIRAGFERVEAPGSYWAEAAKVVFAGGVHAGWAGQIGPGTAKAHDLRDPVLVAEIDLDGLLARRKPSSGFAPLPQFPGIRRDLALVAEERVTHDLILKVVREANPANLVSVELFDVYRGTPVPEGRKSMAYAFTYRAADRTLKEPEVNASHEKLLEVLRQKAGVETR